MPEIYEKHERELNTRKTVIRNIPDVSHINLYTRVNNKLRYTYLRMFFAVK